MSVYMSVGVYECECMSVGVCMNVCVCMSVYMSV